MQGKEKLFEIGRNQTHDPRILITDGPNVLMGNAKFRLFPSRTYIYTPEIIL